MSNINTPTPENIVSITYQLLQEFAVPTSIRGQMPVLTIQFQQDSILRNKVVAFVEMRPYLDMLKKRADSLGKTLLCSPAATFDNKIVITYGDPTDGMAIVVQLALSPDNPCVAIPAVVYLDHAAPFIVGDILYTDNANTIPVTGFDLVTNVSTGEIYVLNTLTGEVGALTGDTCEIPPPVKTPSIITMQLDGVDFDATNLLAGTFNVTSITDDKTINAETVPFFVNFELPMRGFGSFIQDYNLPFAPTFTQINVMAVPTIAGRWYCTMGYWSPIGLAVINNFTSKAAGNQNTVKLSNGNPAGDFDYIAVIPFSGAASEISLQIGGTYKDLQAQNVLAYCGKGSGIGRDYHVIGVSPYGTGGTCQVEMLLNGVVVSVKSFICNNVDGNNFDLADTDLPANSTFNELRFTFVDAAPALSKNVWVVNDTADILTVETDVDVYVFAAGVNGNIVCTNGGNFTNQSGANRKFTFLQYMPATIDIDEVPNPDTLANLGVHVLNASLVNLNYIRAELP